MSARVVITGSGAAQAALALLLAGLTGGALGPALAAVAPWAPAAGLALLLTLAGWLARGAPGALAPRAAVALGGGALAGLLLAAPAGLAHAAFGLTLGLALPGPGRGHEAGRRLRGPPGGGGRPRRRRARGRPRARRGRAGPGRGALAAGAVAWARRPATPPAASSSCAPRRPPGWRPSPAPASARRPRPRGARPRDRRAPRGGRGARRRGPRPARRRRRGLLARDLLGAAARAAEDARRLTGAAAALAAASGDDDLAPERSRLEARREAALAEAGRHAAALARLASSLLARGVGEPVGPGPRVDVVVRRLEAGA
ncbi:MAG: hypothetical protein M9894_26320 [Planctomycetes bacterium]|nr:hypothetical protein [Planctomycetota bacterium]